MRDNICIYNCIDKNEVFKTAGERTQIFNSRTRKSSDSIKKESKDSNYSKPICELESPKKSYKELIESNSEIKVNSTGNITELFISGTTASNDLSDFTVSGFLWPVYCCIDGEIMIIIIITQEI